MGVGIILESGGQASAGVEKWVVKSIAPGGPAARSVKVRVCSWPSMSREISSSCKCRSGSHFFVHVRGAVLAICGHLLQSHIPRHTLQEAMCAVLLTLYDVVLTVYAVLVAVYAGYLLYTLCCSMSLCTALLTVSHEQHLIIFPAGWRRGPCD